VITDSLIFGPFYNGPDFTGVLGPEQLQLMTQCGFNILATVRRLFLCSLKQQVMNNLILFFNSINVFVLLGVS
jgi:hypothetical protein